MLLLKVGPDFKETFKTIIVEKYFNDTEHKNIVDKQFKKINFQNVFQLPGRFGACYDFFYEV